MASQPPFDSIAVDMESFVRGYHSYLIIWECWIGEVLALPPEPHNVVDQYAVAVVLSSCTGGHILFNIAPIYFHFLKRSFNKGTAEIIGAEINLGRGYRLEIPCIYNHYGPDTYVERAKTMLRGQVQSSPEGLRPE